MNEIVMNIGAAQVSGAASPAHSEQESGGEAFGEVLGSMMSAAENQAVTVQEAVSQAEAEVTEGIDNGIEVVIEVSEEITAAEEITCETISGTEITADGAKALMETFKALLSGKKLTDKELEAVWAEVSPKEKAVIADMLETFSQADDADKVQELFEAVVALCDKSIKAEHKDKKKSDTDELAVYMMAMGAVPVYRSNETVSINVRSVDVAENETEPDTVNMISEAAVQAQPKQAVTNEISNELVKSVSDSVERVSPEKLTEFAGELAQKLDIQVAEHSQKAYTNQPEMMLGQSRQAVMSRVTENEPEQSGISIMSALKAANETEQSVQTKAVPEETVIEQTAAQITAQTAETAAPDAVTAQVSVPVSPENTAEIAQRVIDRIAQMQDYRTEPVGELSMKLAPEELGEISIRIIRDGESVSVEFTAQRSEAAKLIGDRAAMLAEAMADRGVRLKELSVTQQVSSSSAGDNTALEYMGTDSGQHRSNENYSQSRHFYFDDTDVTEENYAEDNSAGYYGKEAKLWVSA